MAKNEEAIAELLKNTRFRRRFFGGVDEGDVWKKIERLNEEYVELLEVERQRAQGALNQWEQYAGSLESQIRKISVKSSHRVIKKDIAYKQAQGNSNG